MAEFQPRERIEGGSWDDWSQRLYGQTSQEVIESARREAPVRKPIGTYAIRSTT